MHDFDYATWKVKKGLKYKIDYIFVSKNLKHAPAKTVYSQASDHLPVISDLDF